LENEAFSDMQLVLSRRILKYLIQHPEACDTTDGIMDWWLRGGRVGEAQTGQAKEEVETTLEAMVGKGWLVARKTDASPKLYGINEERVSEIEAFLVKLPDPDDV
jgi:hypothetical protein